MAESAAITVQRRWRAHRSIVTTLCNNTEPWNRTRHELGVMVRGKLVAPVCPITQMAILRTNVFYLAPAVYDVRGLRAHFLSSGFQCPITRRYVAAIDAVRSQHGMPLRNAFTYIRAFYDRKQTIHINLEINNRTEGIRDHMDACCAGMWAAVTTPTDVNTQALVLRYWPEYVGLLTTLWRMDKEAAQHYLSMHRQVLHNRSERISTLMGYQNATHIDALFGGAQLTLRSY